MMWPGNRPFDLMVRKAATTANRCGAAWTDCRRPASVEPSRLTQAPPRV